VKKLLSPLTFEFWNKEMPIRIITLDEDVLNDSSWYVRAAIFFVQIALKKWLRSVDRSDWCAHMGVAHTHL